MQFVDVDFCTNFCANVSFFSFFNIFIFIVVIIIFFLFILIDFVRYDFHSHQISSICVFRYLFIEFVFYVILFYFQYFSVCCFISKSQSLRITVDSENRFLTNPGTTLTFFMMMTFLYHLHTALFLCNFRCA